MSNNILSHFDRKVIITFFVTILVSGVLIAYQVKREREKECPLFGIVVDDEVVKTGEDLIFTTDFKGAYQWRWSFGDGNISYKSSVPYQYKVSGDYIVSLQVNEKCRAEKVITVKDDLKIVDSTLFPVFNVSQKEPIYEGIPIQFLDSTTHATSWAWYFNGATTIASSLQNPTHVFTSPGTKKIALVVNGNTDYISYKEISVLPKKKKKVDIHQHITERIVKKPAMQNDPVVAYFNGSNVPDVIVEKEKKETVVVPEMNEDIFIGCLNGIAQKKLDYRHFRQLFCKEKIPVVIKEDGTSMTFGELYYDVFEKRRVKVKHVSLSRDADECVEIINVDYK